MLSYQLSNFSLKKVSEGTFGILKLSVKQLVLLTGFQVAPDVDKDLEESAILKETIKITPL